MASMFQMFTEGVVAHAAGGGVPLLESVHNEKWNVLRQVIVMGLIFSKNIARGISGR